MGFGRGLLLWLIGIPLPIIILLALFCTTKLERVERRTKRGPRHKCCAPRWFFVLLSRVSFDTRPS